MKNRLATKMVPVTLVVPDQFRIKVNLDGDNSTLEYEELFSGDNVPDSLVDQTIMLARNASPGMVVNKSEVGKGISVRMVGPESQIIGFLLNEFSFIQVPSSLPSHSV